LQFWDANYSAIEVERKPPTSFDPIPRSAHKTPRVVVVREEVTSWNKIASQGAKLRTGIETC
jgi:hypothetical protein